MCRSGNGDLQTLARLPSGPSPRVQTDALQLRRWEKGIDPNRFAFCAFPTDHPKSGRNTFVVNEGNTIFMRDLGRPGGIEVYPTDEELRTQWAKID